jgi:hypothetical protein
MSELLRKAMGTAVDTTIATNRRKTTTSIDYMSFSDREMEGHRPLNIFLVNETDHTLEFCDPKCEWGQEGAPPPTQPTAPCVTSNSPVAFSILCLFAPIMQARPW